MTNGQYPMNDQALMTNSRISRTLSIAHWSFIGYWALAIGHFIVSATAAGISSAIIFEATSAYHHIRVIDQEGIRTLSFDGSMETRMSLRDPMKGHFEYTEYFHMPWLWN